MFSKTTGCKVRVFTAAIKVEYQLIYFQRANRLSHHSNGNWQARETLLGLNNGYSRYMLVRMLAVSSCGKNKPMLYLNVESCFV